MVLIKWDGKWNLSRVAHKNWWEIFFLIEADCGAFLIVGIVFSNHKLYQVSLILNVVVFHETCLVGLDKVGDCRGEEIGKYSGEDFVVGIEYHDGVIITDFSFVILLENGAHPAIREASAGMCSLMLDVIEDQCECHKEIEGGVTSGFVVIMPL